MQPDKFTQGIQYFNDGLYFEAHEVWEEEWNERVGVEKICLQALIQMAVALLKWQSEIPAGAEKMYEMCLKKFSTLPDISLGLPIRKIETDLVQLFQTHFFTQTPRGKFPEYIFPLKVIS